VSAHCTRHVAGSCRVNRVVPVVASDADGSAQHWHITSGKCLHTINDPDNQLFCVDYRPDGALFATAGKDRSVRVYDEATKSLVTKMSGGYAAGSPTFLCVAVCVAVCVLPCVCVAVCVLPCVAVCVAVRCRVLSGRNTDASPAASPTSRRDTATACSRSSSCRMTRTCSSAVGGTTPCRCGTFVQATVFAASSGLMWLGTLLTLLATRC